jgi:lysophospholipase L1-like esterase
VPSLLLLGDSILDNAPYTAPEPDTAAHLRRRLGGSWSVELLARDGAVMADIQAQLRTFGTRPDWLVLSVGGNDVSRHVGLLGMPLRHAGELLAALATIGEEFAARYQEVVRVVVPAAERLVLCTIYEVPLDPPPFARLVRVPLAMLNDRIVRIAAAEGATVLDLRSVCTEPEHFVLQIEPSAIRRAPSADAIAELVTNGPRIGAARVAMVREPTG